MPPGQWRYPPPEAPCRVWYKHGAWRSLRAFSPSPSSSTQYPRALLLTPMFAQLPRSPTRCRWSRQTSWPQLCWQHRGALVCSYRSGRQARVRASFEIRHRFCAKTWLVEGSAPWETRGAKDVWDTRDVLDAQDARDVRAGRTGRQGWTHGTYGTPEQVGHLMLSHLKPTR